jgi:hypothetical protein
MRELEQSILDKWGSENILKFIFTGIVPLVELNPDERDYLFGEEEGKNTMK